MKYLFSVLFILSSVPLFAQSNFTLGENGVTVICDGAQPGDTGVILGDTYTAVSEQMLRDMVANDEDVTKVCTSLVTDMNGLFQDKNAFNQNIGSWDVSNVTEMFGMHLSQSKNSVCIHVDLYLYI